MATETPIPCRRRTAAAAPHLTSPSRLQGFYQTQAPRSIVTACVNRLYRFALSEGIDRPVQEDFAL